MLNHINATNDLVGKDSEMYPHSRSVEEKLIAEAAELRDRLDKVESALKELQDSPYFSTVANRISKVYDRY